MEVVEVWRIKFRPKDSSEWDWLTPDGGRAYGDESKANNFSFIKANAMLGALRQTNPEFEFAKVCCGPGLLKEG